MAEPVQVALLEPEIPANAGAVARLCAATAAPLHLIGRLGFSLHHPKAKRAGMDYWEQVQVHRHLSYPEFLATLPTARVWMLSTRGEESLYGASFAPGDVLLFGPESKGLPAAILESAPDRVIRIPMRAEARSLNLASAAAIALYEAVRQLEHCR